MTPRVLVIGDVMTDILAKLEGPIAIGSDRRARIVERPGGSAATQAVWLARAGLGVDFVGRVGAADHAAQTQVFAREGVRAHLAADPSLPSGRLIVLIDPNGERSFLTDRGANEALEDVDIPPALIAAADHIALSGYSFFSPAPREALRGLIARAGATPVSVDPASAEFLREVGVENFLQWTRGAAILFPNAEEAETLAGTSDPKLQGERLAAHYPLVVIKRGAGGCEAFAGSEHWRVEARPAEAVDTTGAGDAFAAGFLAARLSGASIEDGLRRGASAGAEAVGFVGGRPQPRL